MLIGSISILLGCGDKSVETQPSTDKQTSQKDVVVGEAIWPKLTPSPALDSDIEKRVGELLEKMTNAEKVGQVIQPEIKYIEVNDIREYHLGSVLNGGGTWPNNDKNSSLQDWIDLSQQFYEASMDTSDGGVAIPILWGTDAVHGHNNVKGATLFPHNIGLGAANDPALIRRIGEVTALEVSATGIDWTFGPTVAVPRDDRWGRTYEGYSEDPVIVKAYAREVVLGLQGPMSSQPGFSADHLIATAKHYVGDGGTQGGIDRGDAKISEQELFDIHAQGYVSALDANVMTAMVSFSSWNGKKMHGNEYLLKDILKGRMGFNGFVVGDWNSHHQVEGCTVESCAAGFNAGVDMFMVPEDWEALYKNTLAQVESGEISQERLDDAVRRILRVKMMAGLFEAGPVDKRANSAKASLVGSPEHREVAREAVRKSLVLLKNDDRLLPISGNANVLVAGASANDVAMQSGGWSMTWQGTGNTNANFPGATTIFAGIEQAVLKEGGQVLLSETGEWTDADFAGNKPDVAIVVFGEAPYAEWHGDLTSIEFEQGNKVSLALLKSLRERGVPVVSVFLSGRPLYTNKEINASDAFVAAWLPGSEGQGVADLLIADKNGQPNFDFTGKLSYSWPKTPNQAVLNRGQDNYEPLFAYGYGRNYQNYEGNTDQFDESSEDSADSGPVAKFMFLSRAVAPWNIVLQQAGQESVIMNGNTAELTNGNLSIQAIDRNSQEDSRRIKWASSNPASVSLTASEPQNLSSFVGANAMMSIDVMVNEKVSGDILLSVDCAEGCDKHVNLSALVADKPIDKWMSLNIDLACFLDAPASYAAVDSAMKLTANAANNITVSSIGWVLEGTPDITCAVND